MSNFLCQACLYVSRPRQTLLDKQVFDCQSLKYLLLVRSKHVCQAYVCVVAKLTNTVLDKQYFKCLRNELTCIVWETFKVFPARHIVCQFGHHTNMFVCPGKKFHRIPERSLHRSFVESTSTKIDVLRPGETAPHCKPNAVVLV